MAVQWTATATLALTVATQDFSIFVLAKFDFDFGREHLFWVGFLLWAVWLFVPRTRQSLNCARAKIINSPKVKYFGIFAKPKNKWTAGEVKVCVCSRLRNDIVQCVQWQPPSLCFGKISSRCTQFGNGWARGIGGRRQGVCCRLLSAQICYLLQADSSITRASASSLRSDGVARKAECRLQKYPVRFAFPILRRIPGAQRKNLLQ